MGNTGAARAAIRSDRKAGGMPPTLDDWQPIRDPFAGTIWVEQPALF